MFGSVKLDITGYFSMLNKKLVISPSLSSRILIGEVSYPYMNFYGGEYAGRYFDNQMSFIGINHPQLAGNSIAITKLYLRGEIADKHYIRAAVNYGTTANDFVNLFKYNQNLWGTSLGYAYESLVGPITLDLYWSNVTKRVGAFFNIGYFF